MRIEYEKTIWEDGKTPVNAENLGKIENAIETLFSMSISPSQIKEDNGIGINFDEETKNISFGLKITLLQEKPTPETPGHLGDLYIEDNFLYIYLGQWIKLMTYEFE